ncbi:hypothetical protein [Paludibaculum fermentans]|uniref:IPT/TIG domain-containing protein n=1 Tax=Paludibaculum fermentans TaxID=1473598 RepID=A0A7S7NUM4_PALFE|nr:hypothetical protein [Paludibaculum fermentans]QOY90087.1 hypothetical protein IRI77_09075 [Paludibaculum fermentans]
MNRKLTRQFGSSLVLLACALAPQALPGASTPSISGYAPAATVSVVDLQSIAVYGSGFQRGLSVKLTDPAGRTTLLAASRISQVAANSFQFISRFPVAGDYQVQVTNPDGGVSNAQKLAVTEKPEPTITGVAPGSLLVGAKEQSVTVTGSGFRTGLSVYVSLPGGGNDLAQDLRITSLTANQFDMHLVLDRVGQYGLWVTDPDGAQSKSFSFAVTRSQAAVQLTGINPSSPVVSADIQLLSISGSGFQPGLAATLTNPSAGTSVLAGPSYIRNVTPTGFSLVTTFAEPGTHTLRVTNPDGGQTGALSFEVGAGGASPQISSVLPAPVVASPQSVTLTVLGSGFDGGLSLSILRPDGGFSVLAGNQFFDFSASAFSVVYSFATPGNYTLQFTALSGAKSKSFVLNVPAVSTAPVILAYSPLVLQQSGQLQAVTVHGLNFKPGLKAVWLTPHGFTAPAQEIDPSTVTAAGFDVLGSFDDNGTYLLQVINPDGAKSDYFPIRIGTPGPSSPLISSHAPNPLAASGNVRSLLVQGGDFISGLSATLTAPDTTFVQYTPDQIQGVSFSSFVIAASFPQTGNYTLRVTNPDGSLSNLYTITVDPAPESPTISSISPAPVRAAATGQTLSINGGGFLPGLKVHVTPHPPSGTAATFDVDPAQVQFVSSTGFLITASFSQPWTYDIQIDNPNGTQSNVFPITVLDGVSQPALSGYTVSPSFALTGQNLQNGLSVTIWPGVGDPYQLTGLTPLCQLDSKGINRCILALPVSLVYTGTWRFRVFNPDGGQSSTFEIAF